MPFYYLGDYYQRSGPKQDFDRARKCFEKSFSLNPHSKEAGSALSDVYFKQVSVPYVQWNEIGFERAFFSFFFSFNQYSYLLISRETASVPELEMRFLGTRIRNAFFRNTLNTSYAVKYF